MVHTQYLRGVFTGGDGDGAGRLDLGELARPQGWASRSAFRSHGSASRTELPGPPLGRRRHVVRALVAVVAAGLGWQRLVQLDGVMYRIGLDWPFVTHAIMGPFGVVLLLGLRCVPFTYLAITAALAGLGQEFEDAARVHGASRFGAIRLVTPILAPAITVRPRDRFRRDGERLRRRLDARLLVTLPTRHLPALRGHQRLPGQLLRCGGDRMAPRCLGGRAARAAGKGTSRVAPMPCCRAAQGRRYDESSPGPGRPERSASSRLFYLVALGVPGFGAVSSSLLARLRCKLPADPCELQAGLRQLRAHGTARSARSSMAR